MYVDCRNSKFYFDFLFFVALSTMEKLVEIKATQRLVIELLPEWKWNSQMETEEDVSLVSSSQKVLIQIFFFRAKYNMSS